MIIVMKNGAPKEQIDHVIERIVGFGYTPHPIYGEKKTVIGAIGDERGKFRLESLASVPGVETVMPILTPFKLVGRDLRPEPTTIRDTRAGCTGALSPPSWMKPSAGPSWSSTARRFGGSPSS